MPRRILVPVDGSRKPWEGLEHVLSTYEDASITVLHVVSPHRMSRDLGGGETGGESGDSAVLSEGTDEWSKRARAEADETLDDARDLAADHDGSVSTAVEFGEPWRTIVEHATEHETDHVVMGSHGRADDSPVPLGSVAQTVMRRSPVLVSIGR